MLIDGKESKVYEIYSQCHGQLQGANSHLKGQLLTLVDACFTDAQQRKAFKDLVARELEKSFQNDTREILVGQFHEVGKLVGEDLFPRSDSPSLI